MFGGAFAGSRRRTFTLACNCRCKLDPRRLFSRRPDAPTASTDSASKGGFEAKLQYCQDCHGPSGQGYRGFYPIPRLAGQQTEYIENQLRAFVERRRPNSIMANVAHVLSPAMINGARDPFSIVKSPAARRRAKATRGRGKKNLRRRRPRRQCRRLRRLPRSGCDRQRSNSALGWAALSLSRQGIDELGQGARVKSRRIRIPHSSWRRLRTA